MKVNIDSLRKRLAEAHNRLAKSISELIEYSEDDMSEIQENFKNLSLIVGILMCVYDDRIDGDLNDLSDEASIFALEDLRGERS